MLKLTSLPFATVVKIAPLGGFEVSAKACPGKRATTAAAAPSSATFLAGARRCRMLFMPDPPDINPRAVPPAPNSRCGRVTERGCIRVAGAANADYARETTLGKSQRV